MHRAIEVLIGYRIHYYLMNAGRQRKEPEPKLDLSNASIYSMLLLYCTRVSIILYIFSLLSHIKLKNKKEEDEEAFDSFIVR